MNDSKIQYVLAALVLAASWFCLIGVPGADGKLEGGYAIKAVALAYCHINPEFKECK